MIWLNNAAAGGGLPNALCRCVCFSGVIELKKKTVRGIVIVSILLPIIVLILANGGCNVVTDRSLYWEDGGYYWQGRKYVRASDYDNYDSWSMGEFLSKRQDGTTMASVEEDPSYTFVIISPGWSDHFLYVAADYTIPKSGKITVAHWYNREITDEELLDVIEKMKRNLGTKFEPDLNQSEQNSLKTLYFGYEGCPIATEYLARVGKINGEWIAMVYSSYKNPPAYYRIPEEYISTLEKYGKYE